MDRWEILLQGLALLGVVIWSSRVQERVVDYAKQNRLLTKIATSSLEKTEEDKQNMSKLMAGVFRESDEADAPYTILKTKFDPSPLGDNTPNPNYKPILRDLRKDILKKELKLDKSELKGEVALQVARSFQ